LRLVLESQPRGARGEDCRFDQRRQYRHRGSERIRASRAKAAWARLIRKVYESDPLECPKCKGPMRVIALIEDPVVVRAILVHLGRWQPKALERAPPVSPRPGPRMRARRSGITP
jgi:hypothetical protein